jgi:ketosteroid isomerase-like protein
MTPTEAANIEVVRTYFDGCNTGDVDQLTSTLAPDVTHYFLPPEFPPIGGAEHLAKYWRKFKRTLDPVWALDHLIAAGDEVVSEWSCIWSPPNGAKRLMFRGSEWYVVRDGRIREIRAYFIGGHDSNVELRTFPYADRGYLQLKG